MMLLAAWMSSTSAARSHFMKESLSKQRNINRDSSLDFGPRNHTLSMESSPLSPLVHHTYLQIQATVQKSYTIQVGNMNDGTANSKGCSTTSLQSTCNLRSAWALCMSLIKAVTCPSSANQAVSVTCTIVLPSSSSIAFNSGYGGAMSLSPLSSWASTCKNTLLMLSLTSSTAQTTIIGNGTSTSLLYLSDIPFVRFSMKNVAVMGFGDGSVSFPGAVYLHALLDATFGPGVQFGPNNVGYNTSGALVVHSLPSLQILSSNFVGNSAVGQIDFNNLYDLGGALTIFSSNNILISSSTFVNNSVLFGAGGALSVLSSNNVTINNSKWLVNSVAGNGGQGGALVFISSNTITMTNCSMVNNSNTGGQGGGGAVFFSLSNTITMTNCNMVGNSITGGQGGGGAIFVQYSNFITLTSCRMVNNSNTGGQGSGGAVFFISSNTITMTNCSMIGNNNTGGHGGGGAVFFTSSNTITMTNCNMVGNSNTGGHGWGGAVFFSSSNTITITNCSMIGNSNTGGQGAGGAVFFSSSNTITMTNCNMVGNSITGGQGGGGAVFFTSSNTFTMTNCSMVNNSNTGGNGLGGAISVQYSNFITLTSCRMVNNSVQGQGGQGGALYTLFSDQILIAQCSFTKNIADAGGAIYFDYQNTFVGMTAVHFSQNVASSEAGGAVYVGASCSYMSFGGPIPMLETCKAICDQPNNIDNANGFGHSYTLVQEPTSLHVVGYYVIFNDLPYNTLSYCGDKTVVGDYMYGFGKGFQNCTYAQNDGNTAPGMNGEAPYLYHGSTMTINYTRNNAPGNAYISVWVFPFSDLSCVFDHNVAATNGGAIFIGNSANVFIMPGTTFRDNKASGNGGAVFLASYSDKIYFYSSLFSNNNALVNGGAVAFQNLLTSVHFYHCLFNLNIAQYGGAVYLNTGNGNEFSESGLVTVIEFVNMTMRHNYAVFDGGGIYADNLNVFSLISSRLMDNAAGRSGGAIAMNTINTMLISKSDSFYSFTTFARNTCMGRGGAISFYTGSIVTINDTTIFDSNYAQRQGGAIAVSASSLVFGANAITFTNNSALTGSAMYLSSSSTSVVTLLASDFEVMFRNNVCRKQGGTVFIEKDPQSTTEIFGPKKPYYTQRIVFLNNIAAVGNEVATQTTSLRRTSNRTTVLITDYNLFLRPSLVFSLVDDLNNINTTDFTTTITATVQNYHCGTGLSHLGYLSGVTTKAAVAGIVTFDAVSAYCWPLGNMTILFQAQPSGFDASHYVTTTLTLVFRQCHDGEILVNNACQVCPSGSYSFQYSPTAICTPCPANTVGCSGGIITVSPGYWRLSPLTTDMLPCPFPNACIGGNGTGFGTSTSTSTSPNRRYLSVALGATSGCADGYEGPLCGVCSDKHYFDNTRKECRSCEGQGKTQMALSFTIPLVILSLVLAAFLLSFDLSKMASTEVANTLSGADIETNNIVSGPSAVGMGGRLPDVNMGELASQARRALGENEKEGEVEDDQRNVRPSSPTGTATTNPSLPGATTPTTTTPIPITQKGNKMTDGCLSRFWAILNVSKIMSKVKIIITAYQIVSALPFSLALSFPSFTDVVFHMLSFVNISATAFGSPACYLSFDYYDRLRISTVVPLVVFGVVMFVFFPIHYAYYRWYGKDNADLIRRYFFCILFLAYLFLPSVTVTIFGAFTCTNVDPEGLVPGTPTFLRNDYSISCSSKRYKEMVAWASTMILVYPIGFTTIIFVLLFRARHEIKKNKGLRRGRNKDVGDGLDDTSTSIRYPTGGYDDIERMLQGDIPSPPPNSYIFAEEISFLYEAYKPEYWYWEVIETIRRILMTAVMSIVATGSGAQIVFGLGVAMVFMKLYAYYLPFKEYDNNVCQEVAQYQVFLTLLVALIIRGNLLPGSYWAIALDAVLFIVTMLTPAVSFVLHFKLPDGAVMVMNRGNEVWNRFVPAAPVHGVRIARGRYWEEVEMTGRGENDSDSIPPETYDTYPITF